MSARFAGLEPLEMRQLLSVAPFVSAAEQRAVSALAAHSEATPRADAARSLVVIDASAYGDGGIARSFADAAATLVVGSSDDVFAEVEDSLSHLDGISAIHLVTHGSPGRFTLGSTTFDADTVDDIGPSLLAWNRLTRPGSDLYLWGCDIAGGDGASLVDSIHTLSGFDVAASTDVTGPARLGGDFDLEYVLGDVAAPRLAAGVDVLWETVLSDHDFTPQSAQGMQSAFNVLDTSIAPAIQAALAGTTVSQSVDPLSQRTISSLFNDSSSISPADVESLLSLSSAVSAYLAGPGPKLSGLRSAVESALASSAAAAGAIAPSISVVANVSGNEISLAVSIVAAGSSLTTIDQGPENAPTPWGEAIRTMNTDYGVTFRTAPQMRTGSRLTTGFTVTVDLTDPSSPVASLAIDSTDLAAGMLDFGGTPRFGILDATIGGSSTLPYVSSLSFTGGSSRPVASWASVGASASTPASAPTATVTLPVTATLSGVNVAPGAGFNINLGGGSLAVSGVALGRLPWFGSLSSDDLITAVKAVGGAYETLGTSDTMTSSIPFVPGKSLADAFDFSSLFDAAIGDVIDVTVPKAVTPSPTVSLAFTAAAGGTVVTVTGDQTQTIRVGQTVGLIPGTPAAGATVLRAVQAVSLVGGNTQVTLAAAIDSSTTAGTLVPTVAVRPDDLQTLRDFQNYPAFAGFAINPIYDAGTGKVSIQFSAARTTPLTVAPDVEFNLAPLGALAFTGGTSPAFSPAVSLGFGVQFDVGPGGPIVIALGAAPAANYRLSADASFTVAPIGGSATTVTVTQASTSTNTSLADLVADINAVLGGTLLQARASELGVGIELFTPTVNASMPIGITVAATRNQAAFDLGFTDGVPLNDDTKNIKISIIGRPSGVVTTVVPHTDASKKFAEASFNWSLADLSGTVAYGINTIAFADTAGAVQAGFSAVLPAGGADADAIAIDPATTLTTQHTDSATLDLLTLSRVGATNDIAAGAQISIAVSDFTADRIDSFVPFGALLSVSGLEDSGRGTGRLSADASLRFSVGSDTFEVTVTQAVASNNTTFADLVADFNAQLSGARIVVNGATTNTMRNLSGECALTGSGGRVSVLHTANGVSYPVVEALLVPNLAPGGTTTGRLSSAASLTLVQGQDSYTVTVTPADTAGNTTFADLAADFTAALAVAQKTTGSTTTTVDARSLLGFSASGSRLQPLVLQEVANPNYATVTLPPVSQLGEIGYQAGLTVPTIASALTQAARVFDVLEADLGAYASQDLPLLNKPLADLLALDTGLEGRINAFGKLSASTPQELERALESSLGVPSTDLRITYDSARKAYRIDVAYRASVVQSIPFDVDLYKYYDQLGRVLPKGIDAITDGEAKAPLNVVASGTSILSVGYDLVSQQTFLYGHDGTANRGLANGTSFTITFSVNGQNIELPAKFGLNIMKGEARIQNGSLVVTLSGPTGTPASALFYVQPTTGQRNALDVANYAAAFSGAVTVKMPVFENFQPGTLTASSAAEAQESGVWGFIQNQPATFYLGMPRLGDYMDALGRLEKAKAAVTGLLSSGQSADAQGVTLVQWQAALNLAAADLQGVLFAFAPELENARNVLGAEETLLDFIRDPGMILDKLNVAIGGVESALKGLDKIPLPFVEGKLGGAVNAVFNFKQGWLLDMRNKMRGAGEGIFDIMRQSVFEYLGPKHANILLKYDPLGFDRSLDSMAAATRPEDIGVTFYDKKRNVLATDVRGADAFEIVFRLGQKVFDTGIDMSFQLDTLKPYLEANFSGGLRLQVGWEMLLGFGYSMTDGFYMKVDATQPEAQVRFDATLTGASKNYTQRWDAGGGYWKIVDTRGTTVTTDDQDVIDATTGQPYRAIAVNKFAADVTAFVPTTPTTVTDPCGCGGPPAVTGTGEQIWWVVGTRTGNGDYVPAELNDQGLYVPQANPYAHTLIEVTAMAPARLAGSLYVLRLEATDKIRRGLSGFTDVDSQYFYDASDGPQTTAQERDDEETGVNRNNELPTRFSASVGLNIVDPSANSKKFSVRDDIQAPAGHGTKRVITDKGVDVVGTSGAIYKPRPLVGWFRGGAVDREIQGVFAKEYYDLKLKIAPPAKYEPLDIPVRLATGSNIALSGMGIIDGVQVKVGDRILVKNQAVASQNGIYTVAPGAWTRSFDANDNLDFVGKPMFVLVTEGRANKDTGWNLLDTTGTVTLGVTPLIFERTMVAMIEPLLGVPLTRLKPYVPFQTLPLLAKWVDQPLSEAITINVEFESKNYLVRLPAADGILTGPAIRAAQLNNALATAVFDDNKNLTADAGEPSFNLAQAGFIFQLPASAKAKWYRIQFAHLVEDDLGFAKRKDVRVGNFIDYGTPLLMNELSSLGWDPLADINADASKDRLTWSELRANKAKDIFKVDVQATAVANLTLELSVGDTANSQNVAIPRIYADLNVDWSTRAARAKIEKAKQNAVDLQVNNSVLTSNQGSQDDVDLSLVKKVQQEEIEKPESAKTGGDPGIDPASPLVKEIDWKPEVGFSNVRLDVGSFLTGFLKPVIDKTEPYLAQVRPVLTFLNSRVPVLSDVAGRNIKVVDLLEKFGGPKGKSVRGVIDVLTAVDNLAAQIAALPAGVNIQIPMGRFWFPKEPDTDKGGYKYGSFKYDNIALGINTGNRTQADLDAQAALEALAAASPDSSTQQQRQSDFSNNARDRGGVRVPILQDPLTLFNLMMGKTATLVTYQLPKLQYSLEKTVPLVRIVCFEVGLRASFEMNSNLAFGFDTYGLNQYMVSGDPVDIAQGFYVSDRANADGTGADVPEFQAIVSFGLYGGVDLVAVKAGIEGGLRVTGEVNLNDPNNDGKLRLTEAIGLVVDTGNPLDLFDLSLRGEVYARYYYDVGFGLIKGGKDFARIQIFNLVHQGSDGTPLYASLVDGTDGDQQLPGTLLMHVGEAAPKRVSNQDPLKAKDGAENYKIWNDSPGSGTVHVQYRNYSQSITKTFSGVQRIAFEGGIGDDTLDASGLQGIPVTFDGGDGNDTVLLGSGHATIVSRLVGGDGNDTITVTGAGLFWLEGGVGNDTIAGGTGVVTILAGEGNDSASTRAGSTSTIVVQPDYGKDTLALDPAALQNLLDFTNVASAIEFMLDGLLGATADGSAKAGDENVITFNVGGVTEIRGSTQNDSFTARNPRTRNASRAGFGLRLWSGSDFQDLPEIAVPSLAADGSTTGRLAAASVVSIDIGKYTYTVTVPKAAADNNNWIADLVTDFNDACATASRLDRTNPTASPTVVDIRNLLWFLAPTTDVLAGLLLRGGQGDDLYDFTLDSVGAMASDGIVIDDVQAVIPAMAGTVTRCGACNKIESIAVSASGKGYELPPEVMIVDPTGSGAKATAVIDEQGRVTAIQVIEGGSGYTSPTAVLIAPRSLGDKLVISSTRPAATLSDPQVNATRTAYKYTVDTKTVRFIGWGDAARPVGFDQSEIDSVTVNMPEGVLTMASRVNLFQTFTVNTSRMVQNARIVADMVEIQTDHGFQIKNPIHAVNSGDVKIRVTGDGTNTGEGDLNHDDFRAKATAVVTAGGVASLSLTQAGDHYFFTPSITVGSDGATPGTGARFDATLVGNGGGLSGFTQLSPGSGYYTNPAPVVVIPPPASIQVDAMITSSLPNGYTSYGAGNGRGRVLLFADTGAVSTSGEVFFPIDTRPGTPQGARTVDWIGGDFRYRSSVGLDSLVNPAEYPGISVGTGASFTAVLDADGRVTGFTQVSGGSGYSADLPPLIEIEGLATAVVEAYGSGGSIARLRVTYPGDGYGQPPRVTIKPNGFGRIVNSPDGVGSGSSAGTPMNRVHIRSLGGTLVAVAGAGVGDPLKPIKSDVEKFVAQVTTSGGVHLLEKDGLRIGKDQSVSGITTVNGDVSITTFGGALELGAPRQALDEEGRPLWQDAAKTIPIYDRDPVTGRIIYEGGDIAVGSGDVKLTADDVEVNVDLNASGGSGTIMLQPVRMDAEIGLAGTRARIEGVVTNGRLTGFDATKFWGGRGYTTAPLVIVDPAGQRAFASAVIEAGRVTAIDVIYGGTNYDPANPPFVSIGGGGIAGALPVNQANAVAIVGDDGVITGFTITNAGSGYVTAPQVSIASPGQALVQAVLDTANPDPVTGRFAVKEFVITNPGRNYQSAPYIEVAAPYDFVLDADEVQKFTQSFAQVVIGRVEGQHLIHSPEAVFDGAVVLRAPRAGGTLDVASFSTTGPVSIVGSGNTFHFDSTSPILSGTSISIDDNAVVHAGVSGSVTATTDGITIFGTGKGMIDGDPNGTDVGDNEDLSLTARTFVTVTGAIGSRWKLDDLTFTSQTRGDVSLQQSVALTGSLNITGGAVTVGGVVRVAGDLVVDASSMVLFSANVSVGGNLIITGGSGVTFAGSLTVGGSISVSRVTGAVRFGAMVVSSGPVNVSAGTLVELQSGLVAGGDATFTANDLDFKGGAASVTASAGGVLTVRPATPSRPIRVGTPMGSATGTLDVSDADLAAVAAGWTGVVIGDAAAGTGAVAVGSIGAQQGSRNSWLANPTTIVGGSVRVTQKVDSAAGAGSLAFVARTGDVTVNAAINETATDRNATVSLQAAGAIWINAAVFSSQTINFTSGGAIRQATLEPLTTTSLRVASQGAVSLLSPTNAFGVLAVATSDDDIAIREDSGYAIGTVGGLNGLQVGTATAQLISSGTVTQTQAIGAGRLILQGAGGQWTLTAGNTIGTLAADTGSLSVADAAQLTVGSLVASRSGGTAIDLYAPGGLTLTAPITTAGGSVTLNDAVTLAADVVIDVVDAGAIGRVNFMADIDGTTSSQESLAVLGHVYTRGSIGAGRALESLSVSGDTALAAGSTIRTKGDQTFFGQTASVGTVTVQAGVGSSVRFLGDAFFSGLITATADTAAYDVRFTGSNVAITSAVTFANTGSVTLGDAATDDLHFAGGVSTAAASATTLAGTIRTTNSAATFGRTSPNAGVALGGDATVSTGSGAATFAGTVDGPYRLVVNAGGDTTFAAAVGGTTPLSHLETDAAGRTLVGGGSITTGGPSSQRYADAVVLGANTVFTALNGAAITFGSTLDGNRSLTVNTSGVTTFSDDVGSSAALVSLTTDAAGTTVLAGNFIATSGPGGQAYNDAVTLGNNAVLDAGAGPIVFASTVDGTHYLWANTTGTTTFGGAVGGGTPLAALTTSSGGTTVINGGLVATNAALGQVYNDAVRLGATTRLNAAAGAVTLASTVDGGYRLIVNTTGTTSFRGAVGGSTPLLSVATDAGGTTRMEGGSVTTSGIGGQVYNDPVILGAATRLSGASAPVTLASTVDGSYRLVVNTSGVTSFRGAVGGATPLLSLATDAGGTTRVDGGSVTTSGNAGQAYGDAVVLGANTALAAGSRPITFAATVDGASQLLVNTTGITTFGAAVGGAMALAAITTDAGGTTNVNGGLVRTTGSQTWLDNVVMPVDTTFLSDAGEILSGPANTFSAPGRVLTFTAGSNVGRIDPLRVGAASVTAAVIGPNGGIALAGTGNLVIGAAGLTAPGTISLYASGSIDVPTGGRIVSGSISGRGVTAAKPIRWFVLGAADSGVGSLRQVINNANITGVEGRLMFPAAPNLFLPSSPLPAIATRLTIDGSSANVIVDGRGTLATGFALGAAAAGSTIRGITVRNFSDDGIALEASPGTSVQGCVIQANGNGLRAAGGLAGAGVVGNTFIENRGFGIRLYGASGLTIDGNTATGLNTATSMGLFATGNLAGTRVVNNTFSSGLRGALLKDASNLVFGEIGRGNVLADNRAAPTDPTFAGTGIRAEGGLAGTVVQGNTFTRNNYGFAFIGARDLSVRQNNFTKNTITAIYVEGDNTGSSIARNTFGTGTNKNQANIVRRFGSRGI